MEEAVKKLVSLQKQVAQIPEKSQSQNRVAEQLRDLISQSHPRFQHTPPFNSLCRPHLPVLPLAPFHISMVLMVPLSSSLPIPPVQ